MGRMIETYGPEARRLLVGEAGAGGGAGFGVPAARIRVWLVMLVAGSGCYGASIGLWRAPTQALLVAFKMPVLIGLTFVVNGVLNGVLAAVLGTGLNFRQTFMAIGQSFVVFGLVAGALGPVAAYFTLTLPGWGEPGGRQCYRMLLLVHTGVIAMSGILANVRLLRLLEPVCGYWASRRVLVAWLAGNLFVGAQLSYTFRPFFGNPDLPVQFLRPNPFQGNFYEAVWRLGRQTSMDIFN